MENRWTYILTFLCLATGFFFGSINNYTAVTLDNEVNVLDVLSLLITIGIAVFVPSLIKKAIDDRKDVKMLLIDEVKELINLVKLPHQVVQDLYSKNETIAQSARDNIVNLFHDAELKNDSIREQIEVSFRNHSTTTKEITNLLLEYKAFLTGGVLMSSKYVSIDFEFYRQDKTAFANFEKGLKKVMHEIHKF